MSTDAHTCDLLKLHVHTIAICLDDGCIGIYQLLTATIFIVPNSLLPFNLEENGFMNEYYEHPRVWTYYQHQQPDHNNSREVVLPHDMRSLSPQSAAGPGTRLGPGIGTMLSEINRVPEWFCVHTRENIFATCMNPPYPPRSRIVRALSLATDWRKPTGNPKRTLPAQCNMEERYRRKNMGIWHIKQVQDRNREAKNDRHRL